MFKRIKQHKGFYAYLAADTIVSNVIGGFTLAIINPPAAIAATLLSAGVNVVAGLFFSPKKSALPPPSPDQIPPDAKKPTKNPLKIVFYFYKDTLKNPDFVVGKS